MKAPRDRSWPSVRNIWRLASFARPYWRHIGLSFVMSLLGIPLALLMPVPMKIAVDNVLGGQPMPHFLATAFPIDAASTPTALLILAAAITIVVALLGHLQSALTSLLTMYTGKKLVLEFRAQLFQHVQRLSLAYHDMAGSSDSAYRIQYDANAIEHVMLSGILPLLTSLMTLVGMMWVTAQLDLSLAVIVLGVTPILYALTSVFGERLKTRWKRLKNLESSSLAVIQETLSSMRVVKAFGRESHEQQRFVHRSTATLRESVRVTLLQGGYDILIGLTLATGTAAGLYLGVQHVRDGSITLGQLLLVMAYLAQLFDPLRSLSRRFTNLQSALVSAERALALLDQAPDVVEAPAALPLVRAKGQVEFRDVSFSYPGGREVLREVSIRVPAGTRVGIQGATGAGKTTLVSLLTRFYDPTLGSIMLDGIDIRQFRLRDLRSQFAIVLQEPVLFQATIAENISYGKPGADFKEIVEAARSANAHDFIEAFPQGYETQVGERGMRLSGGERQRISLARAFIKNAPVLILDEPTSSVDLKTEARIVEALGRLMQQRTTFMIAHRLSTLEECDMRLRVEDGHLVQVDEEPSRRAATTR